MNMIKVAYLKGFLTKLAQGVDAPPLPNLKRHVVGTESPSTATPEGYVDFMKTTGKGEPAWIHSDVVNPMAEQAAYSNSRLLPRLGWSALGGAGLVGAGWLATELYRRKKQQQQQAQEEEAMMAERAQALRSPPRT